MTDITIADLEKTILDSEITGYVNWVHLRVSPDKVLNMLEMEDGTILKFTVWLRCMQDEVAFIEHLTDQQLTAVLSKREDNSLTKNDWLCAIGEYFKFYISTLHKAWRRIENDTLEE